MPFSNPLAAGLQLIRQALRSPNYVAGVSGWTINRDGSAEFNNVTIRGLVVILSGQSVLMYSGSAPSAGTLIISISPTGGTDAFGNTYPKGINIGGAGNPGVSAGFTGSNGFLYFPGVVPNVHLDANLEINHLGSGTAEQSFLTLSSAQDATQMDYVALNMVASSADGTGLPKITEAYVDSSSVIHGMRAMGIAGIADIGTITATEPGTGTSRANVAAAETWHSVSSFGTGFGNQGGIYPPVRYRKLPIGPNGSVELDGSVVTTAATAAGAQVFALPTGYVPSFQHQVVTVTNFSGAAGANATVTVTQTGAVQAAAATSGAGAQLRLNCVFPLD